MGGARASIWNRAGSASWLANKRRASGQPGDDSAGNSGGARATFDLKPAVGSYISTAPVSAGVIAAGAAAAGVSVAAQAKSSPPASSAVPAVPEKTELSQDVDADESKPSLDSSLEDALVPTTPAPVPVPKVAPVDVEDEVDHPAEPIDHASDLKVVVSAESAVTDPGMVVDSINGVTSGVIVALPPVPMPSPSDVQPVDNGGDGGGGGTNVDVSAGTRSVNATTVETTSREIEVDFALPKGDPMNSDADGVSSTKIPSPIPEASVVLSPAPSSTVPTPSAATANNGTSHVQNSMAPPVTPGVPSNVDDGRSARSSGTVSHTESNGADVAASQLKVFNRLCVTRGKGGNEAETGDAGGGGGEVGASKAERTLSFDQVRVTKG